MCSCENPLSVARCIWAGKRGSQITPGLSEPGVLPLALLCVPEDGTNNNYKKNYHKSTVLMSSHTRSRLEKHIHFCFPQGLLGPRTCTVLAKKLMDKPKWTFWPTQYFHSPGETYRAQMGLLLNLVASKTLGLMVYSTAFPKRMTLFLKAFLGNSFSQGKVCEKEAVKLWWHWLLLRN